MKKVAIGLPVYNGMEALQPCLNCLLGQTHEDIEVIISDNASTDGSADLAEDVARHDKRVRVIHQPENIGPQPNFVAVMEAAGDAPYFMWRAHDDASDANYVEALVKAHEQAAEVGQPTMLAAGNTVIRRFDLEGAITNENPNMIPDLPEDPVDRILMQASIYRPQWLYGLWRTSAVQSLYPHVVKECPVLTAQDIAIVLGVVTRNGMATTPETTFHTQKLSGPRRTVSMQDRVVTAPQHGTLRDYFNKILWPPLDDLGFSDQETQFLRRFVIMTGRTMMASQGGRQRSIRRAAVRLALSRRRFLAEEDEAKTT